MQDFSGQPGFAAAILLVPFLLSATVFVFLLMGTRATGPVLRWVFRILSACSCLTTLGLAVAIAATN